MRIVWDDAKRRQNLRKHALDFADAAKVFSGITYTIEDDASIMKSSAISRSACYVTRSWS